MPLPALSAEQIPQAGRLAVQAYRAGIHRAALIDRPIAVVAAKGAATAQGPMRDYGRRCHHKSAFSFSSTGRISGLPQSQSMLSINW